MSTTPSGEPEYLELGREPKRKPRRGLVVGIVAGVVVALGLPLGAFAAFQLFGGGGTQPHDVLPGNAVGYVRLDLDPSAPEKIDAVRFLRTFPAFEKYTRITDDRADIREAIFDAVLEDAPCDLTYQGDIEPWLGERFGVALTAPAAGDGREPGVVGAIQVSDEQAARDGLDRLRSCEPEAAGADPMGGWTYLDGYMIVAESEQEAQEFAAAAARSPLADNEQFSSDMQQLGEQGVASMWFSGEGVYQAFSSTVIGDPGPAGSEFDRLRDDVRRQIEQSYRSGAVAFRFDDRYVEVAAVVTGDAYEEPEGDSVADMRLPETTAVALGFANGAEYVDQQWETLLGMAPGASSGPAGMVTPDREVRELERALGLRLPADLQTLVGQSFTFALDGSDLDFGALMSGGDPSVLDLGFRVDTDAAAFTRIVESLESRAAQNGVPIDLVVQEAGDGVVAALNDGYADDLAADGSLTDTDVFQTAVPDAQEAQGVFFLDFDRFETTVLDTMRQMGAPRAELAEVTDNVTKIEALGVSSSNHDGYAEGTLRLTVAD
jgi:hypothetical protein